MNKMYDITKCVKYTYDEHCNFGNFICDIDDRTIKNMAQADLRKLYFGVIKKIAHLLDSKNTMVIGAFTYKECSPLAEQCYRTLSMVQNREKSGKELSRTLRKEAEMCRKVLPCLYKTMTLDSEVTSEDRKRIEDELKEVNISNSCLDRDKAVVSEENMSL